MKKASTETFLLEPVAVKEEVGPRGFTGHQVIDEYHADGGGKLRKDEFHKPARIFSRIDAPHLTEGFDAA